MSKVLGQIKGLFSRRSNNRQLPPGSFPNAPGTGATLGTIHKPVEELDDEDLDDEEIGGMRNYNVPEQTRLREQVRDTPSTDNISQNRNSNPYRGAPAPPHPPLNSSNNQFRTVSNGFTTEPSSNNNFIPKNNNMNSTPDAPSRSGLPFPSQIQDLPSQPPPLKPVPRSNYNSTESSNNYTAVGSPNQPSQPPPNNSQPSFGGFPPGLNLNQSSPPPPNNPQSSFGGFPPGMNQNQSTQPPANNSQRSFGGFPPDMNPNQSAPPPPNNPQPSFGGFPSGMNANQPRPPPPNNPPSSFGGFPPGMNSNQSTQPPANNSQFSPNGFSASPKPYPPSAPAPSGFQSNDPQHFANRANDYQSRLELDYPIENVLIDANIPQAMAVKINDAVEQDRLGNAFHIHRYTFQSSNPQQLSYRDNDHHHRHHHHQQRNDHFGGSRYIREVDFHNPNSLYEDTNYSKHSDNHHYHRRQHHDHSDSSLNHYLDQLLHAPGRFVIQAQNSNDLQHILQQQLTNTSMQPLPLSIDSFPHTAPHTFSEPVFHYTAQALYNDPMRQ